MRKDIIYGPLPDLFRMNDGRAVENDQDWEKQRQTKLADAVELEFGGMPPKPETFSVDFCSGGGRGKAGSWRIQCGTKDKPFTFCFRVFQPDRDGKVPAVITGDENWWENCNDTVIKEANRRGFAVVKFDRTELAPDELDRDRTRGIYPLYPGLRFTAISAWAWGYQRVVDALETLDFIDMEHIAITGHSRGGKTVLLAGATDERIRYTSPSCSGTHGCGCWRFHQVEEIEGGTFFDTNSEPLDFMLKTFPFWMGDGLFDYVGREAELPHDMHFIKALIAPRFLLETNGYGDIWANPRGSYLTHLAAKKAWERTGNEDRCLTRYREGGHGHRFEDFCALFDLMEHDLNGKPLPEDLTRIPFDDMTLDMI